jgi:hypothetical protein
MSDTSNRTTYIYLVSLVAAVGGFLFGYDLSIISGAPPFLKVHFELDAAGKGFEELRQMYNVTEKTYPVVNPPTTRTSISQ